MRRLVIGSLALSALVAAGTADAADLSSQGRFYKAPPVAPAYGWTGFYIGANGGAGWGQSCWTFLGTIPSIGLPAPVGDGCHDPSGGVFGGQIGYNWQSGPYVFGVEAQGDWAGRRGQNLSLPFPAFTNRTRVNGIELFTGRVGYAFGPALLYAKGGAAGVQDRYDFFYTGTSIVAGAANVTRWSGTVGVGLEYLLAPNWSGAVEYDYMSFGSKQFSLNSVPTAFENIRQDDQMFTVRLNYLFR
jgi:outer membrane immunogenic protein